MPQDSNPSEKRGHEHKRYVHKCIEAFIQAWDYAHHFNSTLYDTYGYIPFTIATMHTFPGKLGMKGKNKMGKGTELDIPLECYNRKEK